MAEFMYEGCLFPYRFRSTVHDGLDADVYDAESPVNEGDAVPDVVDDPDDAPLREATNSFCA
jgi:hypothetical protein